MTAVWPDLMGLKFCQTYYRVGEYRIRVLEAGEGEPLIFLHGTGGHAEAYTRNLAAHAEHFRVLAIDMLGHGYSDRPDIDYNIDLWSDHLIALLDVIGAQQALLSGESLGAMVAAWTAIRYPERVKKLVMNTGILAAPNAHGRAELKDALERSRKAAGHLSKEAVQARMAWLMAEPDKTLTAELVDIRYQIYAQPGMLPIMGKIANTVLGGIGDDAWCERWVNPAAMQKIQCPTLVLWTRHNPGQPVALAEQAMQHIPDARLVVLENSAHWPQWEEPEAFNRLHLEFLRE